MRKLLTTSIVFLVIITLTFLSHKGTPPTAPIQSPSASNQPVVGQRTKTSACIINGALPDHECTPGAFDQTLTKDVLCSPNFSTKNIRNVPNKTKQQVYEEYGIISHSPGEFEVDHLISLELGGSNDISNLWPEPANPVPGFHQKDIVENYLRQQVCNGNISLEVAQQKIASDWLQVYETLPGR